MGLWLVSGRIRLLPVRRNWWHDNLDRFDPRTVRGSMHVAGFSWLLLVGSNQSPMLVVPGKNRQPLCRPTGPQCGNLPVRAWPRLEIVSALTMQQVALCSVDESLPQSYKRK